MDKMREYLDYPIVRVALYVVLFLLIVFALRRMLSNSLKQIRLEKTIKKEMLLFKKNNNYYTLLKIEQTIDDLLDFFELFYNIRISDLYSEKITDKIKLGFKKDINPWYNLKRAIQYYKKGTMVLSELMQYLV